MCPPNIAPEAPLKPPVQGKVITPPPSTSSAPPPPPPPPPPGWSLQNNITSGNIMPPGAMPPLPPPPPPSPITGTSNGSPSPSATPPVNADVRNAMIKQIQNGINLKKKGDNKFSEELEDLRKKNEELRKNHDEESKEQSTLSNTPPAVTPKSKGNSSPSAKPQVNADVGGDSEKSKEKSTPPKPIVQTQQDEQPVTDELKKQPTRDIETQTVKTVTTGDIGTQTAENVPIVDSTKEPNKVLKCLAAISLLCAPFVAGLYSPAVLAWIVGAASIAGVAVPVAICATFTLVAVASAAYIFKSIVSPASSKKKVNSKEEFAKPTQQLEGNTALQEPTQGFVYNSDNVGHDEVDGKEKEPVSIPVTFGTQPSPTPAPLLPSCGSPPPPPPLPSRVEKGAGAPPPPPPGADAKKPHGNLNDALNQRKKGGINLRKASERKEEQEKPSSGGQDDLMAEMARKLAARRKGVAGGQASTASQADNNLEGDAGAISSPPTSPQPAPPLPSGGSPLPPPPPPGEGAGVKKPEDVHASLFASLKEAGGKSAMSGAQKKARDDTLERKRKERESKESDKSAPKSFAEILAETFDTRFNVIHNPDSESEHSGSESEQSWSDDEDQTTPVQPRQKMLTKKREQHKRPQVPPAPTPTPEVASGPTLSNGTNSHKKPPLPPKPPSLKPTKTGVGANQTAQEDPQSPPATEVDGVEPSHFSVKDRAAIFGAKASREEWRNSIANKHVGGRAFQSNRA